MCCFGMLLHEIHVSGGQSYGGGGLDFGWDSVRDVI